jgi:hypothetical protein
MPFSMDVIGITIARPRTSVRVGYSPLLTYQNNPNKRNPRPITKAEIPANRNADDSACLKRTGLVCISASRRPSWSASTISTIPITRRKDAKIYFHMAIAYSELPSGCELFSGSHVNPDNHVIL